MPGHAADFIAELQAELATLRGVVVWKDALIDEERQKNGLLLATNERLGAELKEAERQVTRFKHTDYM